MRKEKRKMLFTLLILLLLGIGIGYAALLTNLSINGSTTMIASSWDVHFENLVVNSNSVSLSTGDSAATINPTTRTSISYTITLPQPGDFYEFTVDVKNDGTLDAMIGSITSKMNGIPITSLPAYLEYKISYSDNQELLINQLVAAGDKETIKVYVGYKDDIDPDDLPDTNQTNNFLIEIEYIQADENAVPKLNYHYHVSGTPVYLGSLVPRSSSNCFDNYQDAINFLGLPVFVRVEAKKNREIVKDSLGFIYNNQIYYIPGGPDFSYDEGKTFITNVFGISKCFETTYSDYTQWKCADGNFQVSVRTNGTVTSGQYYGGGCGINYDGEQGCGN